MDWNSEMGGVALALAALAKALASTGALTPEAFTASCADATSALAASKEMDKAKETFASVVNAIAAGIAQEKAEQASGK